MKKFFRWLRNLLWRHKLLSLVCFLAFVVIVILMYIFFSVFLGSNGKYGNRLEGIEKVKLTSKDFKKVEDWIKDTKTVESTSIRLVGRIIYVDIIFNKDADLSGAKGLASGVLNKFEDDEKEFYDFEFVLSQNKENGFKTIGTKSPKIKDISWIKN